jgi:hypothetical protein
MTLTKISVALACAAILPCAAGVHKCADASGKVTYQDGPCREVQAMAKVDAGDAGNGRPVAAASKAAVPSAQGASAAVLPEASEGDYRNAKGPWRGPAQLRVAGNGVRPADANAMAQMTIELQSDGRVQGAITEAGCKLSGLTTPSGSVASASVDVVLAGCKDARFNGRFNGSLTASSASKEARLQLNAQDVSAAAGRAAQSSIDAVLKR